MPRPRAPVHAARVSLSPSAMAMQPGGVEVTIDGAWARERGDVVELERLAAVRAPRT
jgi:hypothetical protein